MDGTCVTSARLLLPLPLVAVYDPRDAIESLFHITVGYQAFSVAGWTTWMMLLFLLKRLFQS